MRTVFDIADRDGVVVTSLCLTRLQLLLRVLSRHHKKIIPRSEYTELFCASVGSAQILLRAMMTETAPSIFSFDFSLSGLMLPVASVVADTFPAHQERMGSP